MRMRILSFSSKPMSSPGRTDKFPPPLMRFLRSDKSNRSSRGRSSSRKTPLFFRKKKSNNITSSSSTIETTQEPSSPKVTCIGQVRVSRSKIKSSMKSKSSKTPLKPMKYTNYNLCCWSRTRKSHSCSWNKWKCCSWKWKWKWLLFDCCNATESVVEKRREEVVEERQRRRHFEGDDNDNVIAKGRRSSVSEMGTTPPRNAFLLTRSRSSSLACRFWGEERDDDDDDDNVFDYGRRSSASEMGTTATSAPKNALLLMRSRPSTLAYKFWGQHEHEHEHEGEGETMGHYDEETVFELGRVSSASEIGTASTMPPPKNALLLTRCRSSSLASRFWNDGEKVKNDGVTNMGLENEIMLSNNRDSTEGSRGERGSNFSVECKSVGVCVEQVAEIEEHCGDFDSVAVKNEGEIVNVDGKNEDGCLLSTSELKLRRCKSEPARRDLEHFDPQCSDFWRLRRLSSVC